MNGVNLLWKKMMEYTFNSFVGISGESILIDNQVFKIKKT